MNTIFCAAQRLLCRFLSIIYSLTRFSPLNSHSSSNYISPAWWRQQLEPASKSTESICYLFYWSLIAPNDSNLCIWLGAARVIQCSVPASLLPPTVDHRLQLKSCVSFIQHIPQRFLKELCNLANMRHTLSSNVMLPLNTVQMSPNNESHIFNTISVKL